MREIPVDEYFKQAVETKKSVASNLPQILLKGFCDLRGIVPILENSGEINLETNYLGRDGISFHQRNHTVHILESINLTKNQLRELSETLLFIDENCFSKEIFSGNYQIIFLSTLLESYGFVYRNIRTGIRVVFAFEVDLTNEKNWEDIVAGKGGYQWNVKFNYDFLKYFKENYSPEGFLESDIVVENYRKIRSLIPKDTLLVLSLGCTSDYYNNVKSPRALRRKRINSALEKEFSHASNVVLIKYDNYIKSTNDLTNSMDHFQRRIYFEIAADMVKIANDYLKRRGVNTAITVKPKPKSGLKTLVWTSTPINYKIYDFIKQTEDKDILNIVGYAVLENNHVTFHEKLGGELIAPPNFQIVVVATGNNFYEHEKILQAFKVSPNLIVDGRVFQMANLNFPRFLAERVAYGFIEENEFSDESHMIYPRICIVGRFFSVVLGKESYVKKISFTRENVLGELRIGNYTSILNNVTVKFCERQAKYNVSTYDFENVPQNRTHRILIGSDVKINSNVTLISSDADNPLVIGYGAVIEDNAVVTKSVPPCAIVGGNPAQIIDYRFSQDIINDLQKIKWWDWNFDKIKKYFPYFSDIKKFISACNKGG